ncbi:MAG: helix-turn-helix transcriptional regulator [Nodosilinea sp.]
MADQNDSTSPPDPEAEPSHSSHRVSIREALRMTLDKFDVNARDLAQRSQVTQGTLSGFRNGRREINTSSLQRVLDELEPEAFVYMLSLMLQSEQAMIASRSDQASGSNSLETDALFALIDTYCRQCSTEEQLALLRVVYKASQANPNLDSM